MADKYLQVIDCCQNCYNEQWLIDCGAPQAIRIRIRALAQSAGDYTTFAKLLHWSQDI